MSESDSVVVIPDSIPQSGTGRQPSHSHSNSTRNVDDVIVLDSPGNARPGRQRRRNRANNNESIVDLTCSTNDSIPMDLVDLTNTTSTSDLQIVDSPVPAPSRTKKRRITAEAPPSQRDAPSILRLNCPVCLESLQALLKRGEELRSTVCGHVFCHNCIRIAIRSSKKCPTCRKKLSEKQTHPLYLPIG